MARIPSFTTRPGPEHAGPANIAALSTTTEGLWLLQALCGIETLPAVLVTRPYIADVGPPIASVARTDAEFVIDPAFASACVATYVAVHVVDAPTASAVAGHATVGVGPAGGVTTSVTAIFDSGTSPVFVTTNE